MYYGDVYEYVKSLVHLESDEKNNKQPISDLLSSFYLVFTKLLSMDRLTSPPAIKRVG